MLSGSLNPPSDVRYIPRALQVLANRASKDGVAQSSGILDTDPELLRQAAQSVKPVIGSPGKEVRATPGGIDTVGRPPATQEADTRPSPVERPGVTGRSPIDPSRSARPGSSEEPGDMATSEWRTPQEMEDYRLALLIAKEEGRPKRGPMPTNFFNPDG